MAERITNELSWVIGGAQGSGVDSAANIFSRACAEAGLHIFGKREYYSNIKGEHSYFTVRVSEKPIRSHVDRVDVLVSFDAETVLRHFDEVSPGGAILYDADVSATLLKEVPTVDDAAAERISKLLSAKGFDLGMQGALAFAKARGVHLFEIPYFKVLEEFAKKANDPSLSRLARMVNVMALSASAAVLEFEPEALDRAIRFIFRTKQKVADLNVAASDYIYNYTKARFAGSEFAFRLSGRKPDGNIMIVQGNQASAMGKMLAGCRFQTYYPITPASDDSEFLESNELLDLHDSGRKGSTVVIQTEDEIAAIAMAIGGALAGARSATATSGPGFSLMAEALGWAGMNEVPIVVSLYQRAGPSTGLPTRHEQGDLSFAIHAGHGEFPRIVLASGDIEESFYDTMKVFNFADRYQMPVIHLLDKSMANSVMTCVQFDPAKGSIDRGAVLTADEISPSDKGAAGNYRRFRLQNGNPISPRVVLGTKGAIFWNTGDEHTEEGHITEDPELRIRMMDKRMSKLDLALKEIPDEDKAVRYGDGDIAVISWGSTKGAILDAMDRLGKEGVRFRFIQVRLMSPFPSDLVSALVEGCKTLVGVEMNYSGQLGSLVTEKTGRKIDYRVVKYNGRPMSLDEVYYAVKRIISGNAPRRQVLTSGT